ncbi:MAG: nickel-dependent lactate racemase [Candidatus Hydrogenedentes bacterium]|nr:nickel-dependent lactate racemase [Candidatus Hydrogenedentota bacterium]
MQCIDVTYGPAALSAALDWGRCLGVIDIADAPALVGIEQCLLERMTAPIGMAESFLSGIHQGERIAIIVSDAYRQTGVHRYLAVLIRELARIGVHPEDIRLIFASGTHRVPSPEQQRAILGAEVYDRFRHQSFVRDAHNPERHVFAGTTSRGTPVELERLAMECDRIIATGAVVLHYFGGFGGGRKSILPGLASANTIAHNHALNLHPRDNRMHPNVRIGVIDGNPVAEDMLEAAKTARVHGIINTVLNRRGEIAGLFVGELEAAHRAAADFARSLFAVPIREKADLVIASAGGAKNYVQSHKALYNAYQAMKPGGRIIFLAPCEEGLGGESIEKWLRLGDVDAIFAALRKQSEIYGQTALSTREKSPSALMVTELSEADVQLIGARKVASLCEALKIARYELGDDATYYVMPSAAYTVPFSE